MFGYVMLLFIFDIDYMDYFIILGGNFLVFNGSIMIVFDVGK